MVAEPLSVITGAVVSAGGAGGGATGLVVSPPPPQADRTNRPDKQTMRMWGYIIRGPLYLINNYNMPSNKEMKALTLNVKDMRLNCKQKVTFLSYIFFK